MLARAAVSLQTSMNLTLFKRQMIAFSPFGLSPLGSMTKSHLVLTAVHDYSHYRLLTHDVYDSTLLQPCPDGTYPS
ncbi:hypothetical protein N7468_010805 [Penicillium chermesinum]|uniref:Uncharacterized protein n=1 Tax=Penicillium chermesinum TaxID=63820 RepID=A0A9W9N8E7_9EURO|nr:uncharacterized protein N7468_010805 [Penicillium chermesinum]KAJ5215126.1 hypothetical protein N7468_010805 [Penicillium chermesinum]